MKSSRYFSLAALVFVLCSACNHVSAQCTLLPEDALEVGHAAAPWGLLDLVHIRSFGTLYCMPNPAVRLDVTGKTYFGQLSLASATSTTQNCGLATEADVILRAAPGSTTQTVIADLILTNQYPSPQSGTPPNFVWPYDGGGRIRFLTTPTNSSGELEVMRMTSSGKISLGTPTNTNGWYTPADPVGQVHIRDKIVISGSDYASIKYNQYSQFDAVNQVWHERRISEGAPAGLGFNPSISPASIFDKELRSSVYLWANQYDIGGSGGADVISSTLLQMAHSKLEFLTATINSNNNTLQMRIQGAIAGTGTNNILPHVFFPNEVLIGSEGIFNSTISAGTGQFDLSTTTHTQNLMLAVKGLILCEEVVVKISNLPWPDYVFNPDYKLMPLLDLERSVKENKHLPDMPSEKEIQTGGINVTDLEAKLVKKVEELTLYMLELKKENEELKKEIEEVRQK